ncbi:MAG TPA: TRAP transporter small permease [Burkholderiaceae bacterium]|nr:TRAP transporter small permease [Burkholderiaceae bacterium]HRA63116.1 TRAP transporter small permease [Burkholderiaceae bacterium]
MAGTDRAPVPERLLNLLAIVLFVGMLALVLAQVVMRKFFEPLVWSEELARYVFIWVSFVGWVIASRKRSHVHVATVVQRLSRPWRIALGCFSDLASLVLAAILVWYGMQLVQNNRDVETVTLFFNYALVYAVVPFSGIVIGITAVYGARDRFRNDAVHVERLL